MNGLDEDNLRNGCVTCVIHMESQSFSGNPLSRSQDVLRSFDGTAGPGSAEEVSLIVVAGRSVCVSSSANPGETDLQALLLGITDPQLDLNNSEHITFVWEDEGKDVNLHAAS